MSWWDDAKDWVSDKWDDANDWLYDKADDFHQGVKSVKNTLSDASNNVKDQFYGLYENSKRAYDETIGSVTDIKPESQAAFDFQKKIAGLPLIGGAYANYMSGKSQRAYNEQLREDYGINWSDTKYPWLSSAWNDRMYQGIGQMAGTVALGGAGAKISKNLKKLYEADRSNKRKRYQRRIDQY